MGSLALAAGADKVFGRAKQPPPNIVFILADDLGYADVACYGRSDVKTPNIDRIAGKGVRLLQGYAASPVCSATRVALITGRYQYRLRVGLEEPLFTDVKGIGLPPTHPTLPSLLKAKGYGTTLIGKWHLGVLPEFGPLQSGYDHFYGFRNGAADYYTHVHGNMKEDLWNDDVPVQEPGYLTELFGNRAVDSVKNYAKARQPFLLSLHFSAPHWPWEAPGDQAEAERLRAAKTLWHWDGGSQKTYLKMIESMDTQIGRVLQALEANHLTNNTIVVFTSDNGGERFSNTWPFSGKKTELLEGGVRVPAIMSWPAQLPKGKVSNQMSISMDWMPTFLAAAGTAPNPEHPTDGMDLLPILKGAAPEALRTLYWRYKSNAQRSVRDGDFKFLKILDNTFLFNVAEDPLERANLKARRPDVYDALVAKWLKWNATMLPEIDDSKTGGITAANQADHIGAQPPKSKADNPDASAVR